MRVDLPGVGRNLQDRYEVALTYRVREPWQVLDGARFAKDDPLWTQWHRAREGMYDSNGAAVAMILRSDAKRAEPDVFCMSLLARFEGYRPGFSELIRDTHDCLTWAVLKAHTENRAGTVRLRSADPRDTPLIDFHYFDEGSDRDARDLSAVVAAVRFVRRMVAPLFDAGVIVDEMLPGAGVRDDDDAAIRAFVRDHAWGHHASCSCAIGAAEAGGVVDSAFRGPRHDAAFASSTRRCSRASPASSSRAPCT